MNKTPTKTVMKQTIIRVIMVAAAIFATSAAYADDAPHVYINPGHGGYDSDDRNVVIYPFTLGDTAGFWESKSNLKKGLALQTILEQKGYTTSISRVTNTTDDDLALSTIVALSNASGADVFYAIHSNALGTTDRVNFPMGIYRGYSGSPVVANSDVLAEKLGPYLLANRSTVWTKENYDIYGDWTFYPSWGKQGLGVLRGNNVVSILNEGSYHDYVPEAYRLLNENYCWVEAWNFSLGADDYFGRLDSFGQGHITGNVRDDRLARLQENPQKFIVFGDDNLRPIHGATVRLLDADGNELQRCVTDTLRNGIYLFRYLDPGIYTVEVSEPARYTQTKQVEVTANMPTYQNFYLKRVRSTAPEVIAYSPMWSDNDPAVKCSEVITLDFNWDMDTASTEAAFTLDPPVEGKFTWQDSYFRLVFTPDDAFDVNTLYTLTLKKSAQHAGGMPMADDFTMQFYTQGRKHLTELAVFPYEAAPVHLKSPTVEFRADSLLDNYNIISQLRVLDSDGNEMAWNKRSIKYNKDGDDYGSIRIPLVKNLVEGEHYTLVLDRSIADTAGIHLSTERLYDFVGVDAGAEKPGTQVVADFDDADAYSVSVQDDQNSAALTAATDCLFGDHSLQVSYTLASGTDAALSINAAQPSSLAFTRGDTLGIHICGDMSYNRVAALLTADDDANAVVTADLGQVDYHGWRYVSLPLTDLQAGCNYHFVGITVTRGDAVMGRSGTIKFDNLLHAASTGIREVAVAGVTVTCSHDYVVASGDGFIQGLQLLDVNGQSVTAASGNVLNVSHVTPGVYLVRVYLNVCVSTHKVLIQ